MKLKGIFSSFCLLLILCFCSSVFAITIPVKSQDSPIITPVTGVTASSAVGQITITNSSGKNIPVSGMLLSFTLDQTNIPSVWGTPWLNWQAYKGVASKAKLAPVSYQYANQVDLPGDVLPAGASITVQFSPVPYNNTAVATNVQLFNLTYPLSPAQITASASYSGGTDTITIKNISGSPISLQNAEVHMSYAGQINSSIWGTPWADWSVTAGAPQYVLRSGVSVQIPADGLLVLSFLGDANQISNISLWVQGGGSTSVKGSMNISLPASPAAGLTNPLVKVTGPSYPAGQNFTGPWGTALPVADLQVGSYTLTTADLQSGSQTFKAALSPNPVAISSATPVNVSLSYTTQVLSRLTMQMPAAPASGIAAPAITVTGPDFPAATKIQTTWGASLQICANAATTCNGITPGNYTITVPKVYSATDAFTASGVSNPVVLAANQTLNLPITYAPAPQGSFKVSITEPALKNARKKSASSSYANYAVKFTNVAGFSFTKNLVTGVNTVALPVNETYQIAAPDVAGQVVTISPASLTVSPTGTANVTIAYAVGAPTKFVVYYGGWEGMLFNLNTSLPSNVTAVNLSFANITSALQVDTAPSGWLTNPPAPNVTMQPSYVNWTVYKYNHPQVKILLAVGGATYSAIWNSTLTALTADTMAKNIAAVINMTYPVYSGNISSPDKLLGNVTIDGVDLDVETGSRLSDAVTANVVLLVNSLKKYLNPDKLITFAAFSVGADPNNSQCTVPGSIHCGEDISLLQSVGASFDWINLMAYDAGQEYANSLYQVALANYARYLPKSKILLGLDIQVQWPGFSESAEQLATKAAWQKQNGYAGAMFWGVGVQNNPTQELQYVTAISNALK